MKTYNRFPFSTSWDRDEPERLDAFDIEQTVIDVGSMDAGMAIELARRGHTVEGCERSLDYRALAHECMKQSGITVPLRSEDLVDLRGHWGTVLCLSVLHWYCPDRAMFMLRRLSQMAAESICLEVPLEDAVHDGPHTFQWRDVRRVLLEEGFAWTRIVGHARKCHRTLIQGSRTLPDGTRCIGRALPATQEKRYAAKHTIPGQEYDLDGWFDVHEVVKVVPLDLADKIQQVIDLRKTRFCSGRILRIPKAEPQGVAWFIMPQYLLRDFEPSEQASWWLRDAIDSLHAAGLTHNDLTRDNVKMSGELPIILDYGNLHAIGEPLKYPIQFPFMDAPIPAGTPASPELDLLCLEQLR